MTFIVDPILNRSDLQLITNLIPYGSRVLDVGCGDGLLLSYLRETKDVNAHGIEITQENVSTCVKKGLCVIQGDADADLQYFSNKIFDYSIVSNSLQATHKPKEVLIDLLRISQHVIVSLPNFGHWYNRFYLFFKGRMPVSKFLSYEWYDTPNIHFCTIKDFVALCKEVDATIEKRYYIVDKEPIRFGIFSWIANMRGKQGIFLLSSTKSPK